MFFCLKCSPLFISLPPLRIHLPQISLAAFPLFFLSPSIFFLFNPPSFLKKLGQYCKTIDKNELPSSSCCLLRSSRSCSICICFRITSSLAISSAFLFSIPISITLCGFFNPNVDITVLIMFISQWKLTSNATNLIRG